MAAGSKEKELEDTLPGAEELAASAEASELRRRLLAVGSNDNTERQRTSPAPSGEPPRSDPRALRATLQFVRRRATGNEEVTVTAVSGAPLPSREQSALPGESAREEAAARPSRARIVLPALAGALLVLVALIHRTLSSSGALHTSPQAPRAAGLLVAPAALALPGSNVAALGRGQPERARPAAEGAAKVAGSASEPAAPSPLDPPRSSPGDVAARMLAAARIKASRLKAAPAPRDATRAVEPSAAPASTGPALIEAPPAEPASKPKPRARLVDDAPRPSLID